jgi:MoxR-like ATPase
MQKDTFVEDLRVKFKAGYPVLAVNTPEEDRAITEIERAAWLLGDGRKVKLDQSDQNLLQTMFNQWPEFACPVSNNNELTVDARKLIALLNRLTTDGADSAENIEQLLNDVGYPVIGWESTLGFSHNNTCGGAEGLAEAIRLCMSDWDEGKSKGGVDKNLLPRNCVIVFKDIHQFLNTNNDPQWRRALRTVFAKSRLVNANHRRPLILLQPEWVPHPDVAHCVQLVDFDPPDEEQLDREVTFVEESLLYSKSDVVSKCPQELRKNVVMALRGFTQFEAANAMSYCAVRHRGFVPDMVPTLHRLKAEALKRDEVLEYVDADHLAAAKDIGGYENYLDFVSECQECYSEEATKAGLKRPKGALILGIPGSGKSMVAMATARLMKLPLIKYDFGSVFGGVVGQSEASQRGALRRVKSMGPCVLLIDEADKAFSGMNQTVGDSGVGQRVFGRLLSWMAMENQDAFVLMTMNRLDGVPIEMLRSGRLDSTFYTEFPDPVERRQIFEIHMRKNNVDADAFVKKIWDQVVKETEDYVGAELEQIVIRATRMAWRNHRSIQPTNTELLEARGLVNPVAKLDEVGIKKIMDFCQDKATPVSRHKPVSLAGSGRQRGSVMVDTEN